MTAAASPLAADLTEGLRRLKLAAMRRLAPELLLTARTQRWTPEELLRTLVEAEISARDASNARTRLKAAAFPVTKLRPRPRQNEGADRLVAELAQVVALPVPPLAGGLRDVVDGLQLQVGQLLGPFGCRRRAAAQRRERPAPVVRVAGPHVAHAGQGPAPRLAAGTASRRGRRPRRSALPSAARR